jgi:excisionase family DNA binding protein
MNDANLLTSGEVAAIKGVNRTTVHRWAEAGKLPIARTLGGIRFFDASVVEAFDPSPAEATA